VLEMLARFCKIPKGELLKALKMRNTPSNEKYIHMRYGYNVRNISAGGTKAKDYGKEKKKLRTIREPISSLKAIQKQI
jgi:hypothetical protein